MTLTDRETTRQLWLARIIELGESRMTQKDWCRSKNISESTLRYWRRKFTSEVEDEPAVDWLKVDVTEETRIANLRMPEPVNSSGSAINIKFGDFTVELQNGCDPQRVYEVLKMLKSL